MSFLTGTSMELLYASVGAGTQLATFTTENNLQQTLPFVIIPAGFFYNAGATGKSLAVRAYGQIGTTGAPTFSMNARFLTSSTWSAAGLTIGTGLVTAGTTQTLAPWRCDIDMTMRSLGAGPLCTLEWMGMWWSPLGLASPFAATLPANNTAFTVTTFDNSVTNYFFLSAACGTSSGSNLINLQSLKLYGEN